MAARDCVDRLLNPALSIAMKAAALAEYMSGLESFARHTHTNLDWARSLASAGLFAELSDPDQQGLLQKALDDIAKYNAEERREHRSKQKERTASLRALEPGSVIVIAVNCRRDIVHLIEVKSTRFICEYPDGRRYALPADLFDQVYDGPAVPRLSNEERQRRDRARMLGGEEFTAVKTDLIAGGLAMIPTLLDELAAAFSRMGIAPVGTAQGVLGPYIGLISQLNTHDQALVKRIPLVIADIAVSVGKNEVLEYVSAHPDTHVRSRCTEACEERFAVEGAVANRHWCAHVHPRRLPSARDVVAVAAVNEAGVMADIAPQGRFRATLTEVGPNKIAVIKAIREAVSLDLREALESVDAVPWPIREHLSLEQATRIVTIFSAAGAAVSISAMEDG